MPEAPDAALVVDCTVCQISLPKAVPRSLSVFFSGKHFVCGLKKEVCVNVRMGTAALVSKARPSSVHDIVILRNHAASINGLLRGRTIPADLSCRGANGDVSTLVVCYSFDGSLRMGVKFFGVFALGVKIPIFLALNFHIRFSKPLLLSIILLRFRASLRPVLFQFRWLHVPIMLSSGRISTSNLQVY